MGNSYRDETLPTHLLVTSCSVAWFLTGHGLVMVCGLERWDPCSREQSGSKGKLKPTSSPDEEMRGMSQAVLTRPGTPAFYPQGPASCGASQ